MNKELIVKRNKYGFRLVLDDQIPFEELLNQVKTRFQDTANFYKDAQMAIAFEGRELTDAEALAVVKTIEENSSVRIVCIMDEDPILEKKMQSQLDNIEKLARGRGIASGDENGVEFYRGSLRSGQVLECASNVTLIGDVNPGAMIVAPGNIVILGSMKGKAYAGACGDPSCFIFALEMKPIQLQIADVIAKSPDHPKKIRPTLRRKEPAEGAYAPQVAFTRDGRICISPAVRGCFNI